MDTTRLIMGVFTLITLITLAIATANDTPNCNDPATWATASGVQHCAINGGE